MQLSVAARNARLAAMVASLGAAPLLKIYTGPKPADCAASSTGTLLASLVLPSSPFGAPSAGSVAKAGTWEDLVPDADGDAEHFRVFDSTGTTCHAQGTVSATGDGGELQLDSVAVVTTRPVVVTAFAIADGNA